MSDLKKVGGLELARVNDKPSSYCSASLDWRKDDLRAISTLKFERLSRYPGLDSRSGDPNRTGATQSRNGELLSRLYSASWMSMSSDWSMSLLVRFVVDTPEVSGYRDRSGDGVTRSKFKPLGPDIEVSDTIVVESRALEPGVGWGFATSVLLDRKSVPSDLVDLTRLFERLTGVI